MSVQIQRHHTVACDFCPATHGDIGQYGSAVAARRGALAAGWRLVPKRLSSGRRGKAVDPSDNRQLAVASATNNDVCPTCLPCSTCSGTPPKGFSCNTCGTKGPDA